MATNWKPDHAIVRTLEGRTYVFYPFDTKEPNKCPVYLYEGNQRVSAGFASFREYEETRPANAHPDSLALYNAIPARKNKRLNHEGVVAIKYGYRPRTTGDTHKPT